MNKQEETISGVQLAVNLIAVMVGVRVLSLPRVIAEAAGPDGWLAYIIGGTLALGFAFVNGRLLIRFPGQTVFEFSKLLVGRWLAGIIGVVYVVFFLLAAGINLRYATSVIKVFLLDKTPQEFIAIIMLLAVVYLVRHGIGPLVRIQQLFVPVLLVILVSLLGLSFTKYTSGQFMPFMHKGVAPVLKGSLPVVQSFVGISTPLFLAAFLKQPKDAGRYFFIGTLVPVVLVFIVVVAAYGVFGDKELTYLVYPTVMLAKAIEVPGAFVSRLESFFMAFWIIAAFNVISSTYFSATLALAQMAGLRTHLPLTEVLLPIVLIISILPENMVIVEQWTGKMLLLGMAAAFLIPLLLLVVAWLRKKGVAGGAAESSP